MEDATVIIVGGGIAGINCARHLHNQGIDFCLVESTDALGGRIKTDEYKGFLLDHGFQVFLSAYPEARQALDYDALEFKSFKPGAIIRINDRFKKITDPSNQPLQALGSLFAPIGTLSDKFKLASLRNRIMNKSAETIFTEEEELSTMEYLEKEGFSDKMIDRLFRPFLGGIYLNSDLQTSSKMLEFVFRMFSEGDTCLPKDGMQAIPRQLASELPGDQIMVNSCVEAIEGNQVKLQSGETLTGKAVAIATEGPQAANLLDIKGVDNTYNRTYCYYFATDTPPTDEPMLMLDGDQSGPVNSLTVMDKVSPDYAPEGKHLLSLSIIDEENMQDPNLDENVVKQMASWFGRDAVRNWEHLQTYTIDYAVPKKEAGDFMKNPGKLALPEHHFIAGDHLVTASTNGALTSGRYAAERVMTYLG